MVVSRRVLLKSSGTALLPFAAPAIGRASDLRTLRVKLRQTNGPAGPLIPRLLEHREERKLYSRSHTPCRMTTFAFCPQPKRHD
jgi:hypothetical protein